MRLLIIGGSNSVAFDGYVSHLCAILKENAKPFTCKNLSVGAATTLAGVGRLYETFANEEFDFILYEYTINDTAAFMHRVKGAQSYLICLQIFLDAVAKLYPSAVLVPILLAEDIHFSLKENNPIYDLQVSLFSQLSVPYLDIRKWMTELFLGKKPLWLYKDAGHYSIPHGISMVGSLVATHLLQLSQQVAESILITRQKFAALKLCRNLAHVYAPASVLLPKTEFLIYEIRNRLMYLHYARIQPGQGFTINSDMYPLAIHLKSDSHHDVAQLSISTAGTEKAVMQHTEFSTCHADTAVHKFIYSSIIVPLLFGKSFPEKFMPTAFTVSVPEVGTEIRESIKVFDAFMANPKAAKENYLDLIGVLFVKEE